MRGGDVSDMPLLFSPAFEVTDAELAAADDYERPAAYVRIAVVLASGASAWVYVHARQR